MKNVLKVVLLIAVAGLVFICYRSVMNPIEFQEVKEQREEVVIKRLVDIKPLKASSPISVSDSFNTTSVISG